MQDFFPPEVKTIVLLSLLNPGTIVVGYLLGRRINQKAKIILAAFGAGIAGAAFAAIAPWVGLAIFRPSLMVGIFVLSFIFGFWWAWLGYRVQVAKGTIAKDAANVERERL
jgi:hypothetical protein